MGRKKGKDFKRDFWKVASKGVMEESWVRIKEIWKERVVIVLERTVKLVMMNSKGER